MGPSFPLVGRHELFRTSSVDWPFFKTLLSLAAAHPVGSSTPSSQVLRSVLYS